MMALLRCFLARLRHGGPPLPYLGRKVRTDKDLSIELRKVRRSQAGPGGQTSLADWKCIEDVDLVEIESHRRLTGRIFDLY